MLSINQSKLIRSLHQKKYREKHGMFLIEGEKIITDLFTSNCLNIKNTVLNCATKKWIENKSVLNDKIRESFIEVDYDEIKKLSSMLTPPEVLSIARIPEFTFDSAILKAEIILAFEAIRDPGNLGTIIRTADWFGIKHIICSKDSVDAYNPKVVQSSMGGVMRVNTHFLELTEVFEKAKRLKVPIYGTTMDGEDFFDTTIKNPGIVVFGNESNGISDELAGLFKSKIRIPEYPIGNSGTESLNVAASVAIVCSEIRRRER